MYHFDQWSLTAITFELVLELSSSAQLRLKPDTSSHSRAAVLPNQVSGADTTPEMYSTTVLKRDDNIKKNRSVTGAHVDNHTVKKCFGNQSVSK